MAIEALAAAAVKEVGVQSAREAANLAVREINQKMAAEMAGQGRTELQTAMVERQAMQENFRIGEMPDAKGEARELLMQQEADAAEELRGKLDSAENPSESRDTQSVQSPELSQSDPESNEQQAASECKLEEGEDRSVADDTQDADEVRRIKTIRDDLSGQEHPETGVPYVEKIVETDEGEKVKGVFPVFESEFDAQLPDELLKASDKAQFSECNKQLKEAVSKDPEFAKKFSDEQLEQINNGDTPDGYTWHHNEEKGKMQLVDSKTHADTRHTGGKAIWGGGSEFRA